MANYKVALDAGHGGSDPGAVYNGRQEKDDTLDLTLAVGDILKKNGVDVFYTRTTDEYETPFKKATDANNSGADLFISIHRNSSETPNQYSGVESLVFNDTGLKAEVARNINNQLEDVGFKNLGVDVRKNLVVLMLKNYGYNVIDMGKDVPCEDIVDTAIRENAAIIGLSALMTTTMMRMQDVVELCKEKGCKSKVIIGGACITQSFADEIGADGYSKDAAECVRLVERLLA